MSRPVAVLVASLIAIGVAVIVYVLQWVDRSPGGPTGANTVILTSKELSADQTKVLETVVNGFARRYNGTLLIFSELSKRLDNNSPKLINSLFGSSQAYSELLLQDWKSVNSKLTRIDAVDTVRVTVLNRSEYERLTRGGDSLKDHYAGATQYLVLSAPGIDGKFALVAFYREQFAGSDHPATFNYEDGLVILKNTNGEWNIHARYEIAPTFKKVE